MAIRNLNVNIQINVSMYDGWEKEARDTDRTSVYIVAPVFVCLRHQIHEHWVLCKQITNILNCLLCLCLFLSLSLGLALLFFPVNYISSL